MDNILKTPILYLYKVRSIFVLFSVLFLIIFKNFGDSISCFLKNVIIIDSKPIVINAILHA